MGIKFSITVEFGSDRVLLKFPAIPIEVQSLSRCEIDFKGVWEEEMSSTFETKEVGLSLFRCGLMVLFDSGHRRNIFDYNIFAQKAKDPQVKALKDLEKTIETARGGSGPFKLEDKGLDSLGKYKNYGLNLIKEMFEEVRKDKARKPMDLDLSGILTNMLFESTHIFKFVAHLVRQSC